ncbi:MAG: hypothetical protein KGL35_24780 [Bradyrhizobium sp.]|nr:hypothetical protein [Bradyrhizobium sp.]
MIEVAARAVGYRDYIRGMHRAPEKAEEWSRQHYDMYMGIAETALRAALEGTSSVSRPQAAPDYKACFFDTLKMLHEALDVIEGFDTECLLPGQLKDLADAALVHRDATSSLSRPEGK